MLTIAAHPLSVLENPAFDVIRSIPPVWDETVVLPQSRIGRLSAFARRKGEMWLLAVMAGREGAALTLPLSFLGEGVYEAALVRDVPGDPAAVRLENAAMTRGDSLQVTMPQGGGFVGRFRRR
jgi:alpha-glucosidase